MDVGINYNNWIGKVLRLWIKRIFNKKISLSNTYKILHKLKYSKTRTKKCSKNVDKENLEKFRQEMNELLENKKEESFNKLIEQIHVYFKDIKINKDRISKLCAYIY